MATIWYMWPTKDGKGWIVATRIEGDMNAALNEGDAMGLPKPVPCWWSAAWMGGSLRPEQVRGRSADRSLTRPRFRWIGGRIMVNFRFAVGQPL